MTDSFLVSDTATMSNLDLVADSDPAAPQAANYTLPVSSFAPPFVLKISNVPSDLSHREATIIFSLVIDDIVKIELNSVNNALVILAFFKTFNTCLTTSKLLNNKFIFGNENPPIYVELDEASLSSTFGNLQLNGRSQSQASVQQPQAQPPASHSQPQAQAAAQGRSRFLFNDPFSPDYNQEIMYPWNNSSTSSQPQTPLNNNLTFDWAQQAQPGPNSAAGPASSAPNGPTSAGVQAAQHRTSGSDSSQAQQSPADSASQPPLAQSSNFALNNLASNSAAQNRRTSSAFFNQSNILTSSVLNGNGFLINPLQQPAQSLSKVPAAPPTVAQQVAQPPKSLSNSDTTVTTPNQQPLTSPVSTSAPTSAGGASSGVPGSATARKDIPDLSLLARVPPPANPADQNPPCNTLYVGNLPPDATEQELRSLFSPQKGFRRLSFRTKTSSSSNSSGSSNNHGPMCFVEFEDVAHATRALAELYGRILPRSSSQSNGKGGIRLSFSKNPLGVRGPSNPRRSSALNTNGGSSFNYNYHMK